MSREKSSRVSALYILAGKGKPGRKTKAVEVVEGKGIPGDAHFEDARAPVSIAAADIGDWMAGQDTQGLCFERFKANLWIRIPQEELKRVVAFRKSKLEYRYRSILGVCLSSRRNLCIHPKIDCINPDTRVDISSFNSICNCECCIAN